MRKPLAPGVALLAACAVWQPGEDPAGIEARNAARPVLPALVKFQKDRHEWPSSLHELVPKYLAEVPFSPGLYYDRDHKVVQFSYFPTWPQQDPVNCGAKLGELDWTCEKP